MRRWLVCLLLIGCIGQAQTKSGPKTPNSTLPPKPVKNNPFRYIAKPTAPSEPAVPIDFMGFLGRNLFVYVGPVATPSTNESPAVANQKSPGKEVSVNDQVKIRPSLDRLIPL